MQVPAESRIRVADMLRLVFHFFNIVNLTLGLIVFGVGVSLTAAPLPIDGVSKEISVIYGTLLITAVVVILMGFLGIYGCYWVQETGLKFYAVSTILAILLEICLFSMSIVKKGIIIDSLEQALEQFRMEGVDRDEFALRNATAGTQYLSEHRVRQYIANTTYRSMVDVVHTFMSCCSFTEAETDHISVSAAAQGASAAWSASSVPGASSCYQNDVIGTRLGSCADIFEQYIRLRLGYIQWLAFILMPIQMCCLGLDVLVLKTLKVTKDYEKLERELSNKKRRKRSQGYVSITDLDTSVSLRNSDIQRGRC